MTLAEQIAQLALAGVGLHNAEATIGRPFTAEEKLIYRKARTRYELLEAKRKKEKRENKGSRAEQARLQRNIERDIVIPPCKNPRRRAKCEKSLVAFLETYCMEDGGFLADKPAPSMYPIIEHIQSAITSSGWYHVRMPRGHGKTSYVKGGIAYALAYGFRKYVVAVSAAGSGASSMLRDIFALFERSETFAEDFPEVAVPIRALDGKTQRAKSLTVKGKPCNIRINAAELNLPEVEGYPSSGGIVNAVGFTANARGKVKGKIRPDLVIFDDLQDEESAKSQDRVREALSNIEKNFLNLGGHTKTIAALMTSTPIEPDDLSETIATRDTWYTSTFKMVLSFPKTLDTLWAEYNAIRRHERIQGRKPHIACNRFYRKHRKEMDAGAEVLNPRNYDRAVEVSGIQHAMNLYYNGEEQFYSEYQMQPKRRQVVFALSPSLVVNRTRKNWAPFHIPPESVLTICATDLNPSYGFTSAMITFDRFATGTVVWYGIHRTNIHREHTTEAIYRAAIYDQLVILSNKLKAECAAHKIELAAWAIDGGGEQFEPVQRFRRSTKDIGCPFDVVPMLGRAGKTWNPFVRSRIRQSINETVECGATDRDGNKQRWTNFDADYWRETMQRAWIGEIGTAGGLSLFGDAANINHDEFASQVSAEQLRSKEQTQDGTYKYVWTGGDAHHDYADAVTMCVALAGNRGLTQGTEYVERKKKAKLVFL